MPKPHLRILVNMTSQYGGKPSGVARVAFSLLARLLEQTPHDYVLRSPWTRGQLPETLQNSRLEVLETPRPHIMVLDVLRQALLTPLLCRRRGIDILLNMDPFGSPLGGRRRLTVVHDLYFKTIPDEVGWRAALTTDFIFRLMMAGSHHIICVSEATRNDLTRWYPSTEGRSLTIHSDSTMAADALGSTPPPVEGDYILAVGNATSNKNFTLLARAFAQIAPRMPGLRLVHVGRDDAEEILSALNQEALGSRAVRLQGIDDGTLAALYRNATCLCVPSTYEGFCLPVLEAQQFGCPVVCANRSATPEIAGEGALTFDPASVDSLTAAFTRFFGEPGLADQLRQAGYENRKRFSWDSAAKQYAALFGTVRRTQT